jgi:hypothetical protein
MIVWGVRRYLRYPLCYEYVMHSRCFFLLLITGPFLLAQSQFSLSTNVVNVTINETCPTSSTCTFGTPVISPSTATVGATGSNFTFTANTGESWLRINSLTSVTASTPSTLSLSVNANGATSGVQDITLTSAASGVRAQVIAVIVNINCTSSANYTTNPCPLFGEGEESGLPAPTAAVSTLTFPLSGTGGLSQNISLGIPASAVSTCNAAGGCKVVVQGVQIGGPSTQNFVVTPVATAATGAPGSFTVTVSSAGLQAGTSYAAAIGFNLYLDSFPQGNGAPQVPTNFFYLGVILNVPPLSITTTTPLTPGTVGVNYSQTLTATGGSPPYTWSIASGALPAGLTLTGNVISGKPTTSGTSNFTLSVTDTNAANAMQSSSLTISPMTPPNISSLSPPSVNVGGPTLTLTINGTGFESGASVFWQNTQATLLSTTYLNSTQLTAVVPASLMATAGNITLTVINPDGSSASATISVTSSNIYYFPQLALGGGYQTTLTYVNYSTQSVTCQTNFYNDTGGPLQILFADDGLVSSRTDNLASGAIIHVQSQEAASSAATDGWATGQCTGPVKASLLYRNYNGSVAQGEASVPASTALTTEFVTFSQGSTGLAWANPSSSPAVLTVTGLNSLGIKVGSTSFTLQPNAHGANNLVNLIGVSNFTGSLQLTSTQPIISLSLNAEAFPVFSSLPPGDLPSNTTLASGTGGTATSNTNFTNTYYFPQLALGGGYQTTLTYVNYSAQSVTCQTTFYNDTGGPLQILFADDGLVSSRTDNLAPGAIIHVQSQEAASSTATDGWATGQCSGPVKASLLYRNYNGTVAQGEASVPASTGPTTEFATFAQGSTGLAWANPSSSPAVLTVTGFNSAGLEVGTTTFSLQPNAHGANNLVNLIGVSNFTGSLQLTSTVPIISLSLNAEAFPVFSSLPPGDLPAGTPLQ